MERWFAVKLFNNWILLPADKAWVFRDNYEVIELSSNLSKANEELKYLNKR